jgi:hypothetical protein
VGKKTSLLKYLSDREGSNPFILNPPSCIEREDWSCTDLAFVSFALPINLLLAVYLNIPETPIMEHASTISSASRSMILSLPDELSLEFMEHIERSKDQISFMRTCKAWKNLGMKEWRREISLNRAKVKTFLSSISIAKPGSKEMCWESSLSLLTRINADMEGYYNLPIGSFFQKTATFPLPSLTTINLYCGNYPSLEGMLSPSHTRMYNHWAKQLPVLIQSNRNQGFVQDSSSTTKKTYKRSIYMSGPPGWPITTKCEQQKSTMYGVASKQVTQVIHTIDLSGFPSALASWFDPFSVYYLERYPVPQNSPLSQAEDQLAFFIATSVERLIMDESQTKAHALLQITGLQDNQLPVKKAIFDYLEAKMKTTNSSGYVGSISDASSGIPKIPWDERAKRKVGRIQEEWALRHDL